MTKGKIKILDTVYTFENRGGIIYLDGADAPTFGSAYEMAKHFRSMIADTGKKKMLPVYKPGSIARPESRFSNLKSDIFDAMFGDKEAKARQHDSSIRFPDRKVGILGGLGVMPLPGENPAIVPASPKKSTPKPRLNWEADEMKAEIEALKKQVEMLKTENKALRSAPPAPVAPVDIVARLKNCSRLSEFGKSLVAFHAKNGYLTERQKFFAEKELERVA